MIPNKLSVFLFFCFFFAASVMSAQQSEDSPDYFDLVIFGKNLNAENTRVWLRENPGVNNSWHELSAFSMGDASGEQFSTLVVSAIPVQKFVGQDVRENYIAVKVKVPSLQGTTEIRAVYAFPHTGRSSAELAAKIHQLILNGASPLPAYSIAYFVRPRPFLLSGSNSSFIEHIEAPVKHLKPGIQEAKWLNILMKDG